MVHVDDIECSRRIAVPPPQLGDYWNKECGDACASDSSYSYTLIGGFLPLDLPHLLPGAGGHRLARSWTKHNAVERKFKPE